MLMRRFMPPEYVSILSLALSESPQYSRASSTRSARTLPLNPYIFPQKVRFSRAVSEGYSATSWGTNPKTFLISWDVRVTSFPFR